MNKVDSKIEQILFKMHPRVFTALGADLVTNDLVAVFELVKNSYDAFATRVDIRFLEDSELGKDVIEIRDDGQGMDETIIKDVWCVVGTPFRTLAKVNWRGKRKRRVSGEKGLGRLSAARLGESMKVITKLKNKPCYEVDVNWKAIASVGRFDECAATVKEVPAPKGIGRSGTIVKIYDLSSKWAEQSEIDRADEDDVLKQAKSIDALKEELSRFIPPFRQIDDFEIYVSAYGEDANPTKIEILEILKKPPYLVKGSVDEYGVLSLDYKYSFDGQKKRLSGVKYLSGDSGLVSKKHFKRSKEWEKTKCGPFNFELRVWDFDKDSLFELDRRFNLNRKVTAIRKLISDSPFSGISLYRDDVLVLPKSNESKDWIGLNLRRVSRVGTRISANQIVGYVSISGDENAELRDTSDRERLVANKASLEFRDMVFKIVEILENERDKDRTEPGHKEPPLQDLFASLKADDLQEKIEDISKSEGSMNEVLAVVEEHSKKTRKAVDEVEKRFFYYSRLASIGSLAIFLQHEVGNHIGTLAELAKILRENLPGIKTIKNIVKKLGFADHSIRALKRLADIFSPLASQTFGTRRRKSNLDEILEYCLAAKEKEIQKNKVIIKRPEDASIVLSVDPGELTPIIVNLLDNALYWLTNKSVERRKILIEVLTNKQPTRVTIRIHDSGLGVDDGDEERIFWPGVTKKPEGIGMGLTVASELVAQHGGKMYLIKPGKIGGASFGFDLPLAKK